MGDWMSVTITGTIDPTDASAARQFINIDGDWAGSTASRSSARRCAGSARGSPKLAAPFTPWAICPNGTTTYSRSRAPYGIWWRWHLR